MIICWHVLTLAEYSRRGLNRMCKNVLRVCFFFFLNFLSISNSEGGTQEEMAEAGRSNGRKSAAQVELCFLTGGQLFLLNISLF